MAGRQQYISLSIKFVCGILILLFLATALQHSGEILVSGVNAAHGIATQLYHIPAPSRKVGIPFGNQNSLQAIDHPNGTFSVPGSHLPSSTIELWKRAFTWKQALSEGERFLGILDGPRLQNQDNTFYTIEQLQFPGGGWVIGDPATGGVETRDLDAVFDALGIRRTQGTTYSVELKNTYSNCAHAELIPRGCEEEGNGGDFTNIYNVPGKAIVGTYNFSPAYCLKSWAGVDDMEKAGPGTVIKLKDMLPRINRCSEIVWIMWLHLAGDSVRQLKYIFKHDVITPETAGIMYIAADRAGHPGDGQMKANWPGVRFPKGTEEFQALPGTPHGKGIVFLLVHHPNELGTKNIESITVLTARPSRGLHLLFTLTD